MKLFVTGSESFIGRALLARCAKLGIEAVGVDCAPPGSLTSTQADIRDNAIADLVPKGSTVLHLAAISRDSDCRADPRGAFDINVSGTINIAAAAQKRNCAQLIFASSEWVYGDVRNDEVQLEDCPIDVTAMKSEYALTKIVAEQCLRLTCSLPAVTILRFGIVYGPRPTNWSAVETLFNAARAKAEIQVGAASTARRFIHVDDIVSGILAACNRTGYEIFNLSGDRPVSLREVIEASARMLNRTVNVVETNPSQPSVRNPDNAKAKAQLGWQPAIDLATGLASLHRFFQQAGIR